MYVPGPAAAPKVKVQNLEKFLVEFEDLKEPIAGGVAVYGPAAAYALVWEYGRSDVNPGPKTLWSTNPLGQKRVMTKTAPHGYVAIHEDEMWPILVQELSKVSWDVKSGQELRIRLEVAIDNASQQIATIISASAPFDTGDLKAGIQYIDSSEGFDVQDLSSAEGGQSFVF